MLKWNSSDSLSAVCTGAGGGGGVGVAAGAWRGADDAGGVAGGGFQ